MVDQSSSLVRAAAVRSSALSLANSCSIGFEIGAVRRQVQDRGAGRGDRLADAGDLVRRQVVEHHDIIGFERRRQELLDVRAKRRAGHGPVEHQRRDDAALAEPGHEGGGAPVAVRHRRDQTVTQGAPAIAPGQAGGGAGLVEEHEARRVHEALPSPPAAALLDDVEAILLGGPQGFF